MDRPIIDCVLNDKGGVGKTTVISQVIYARRQKGRNPILLEADSKKFLSRLFPNEVNSVDAFASTNALALDGFSAVSHLKTIIMAMQGKDDAVIDLGANVSKTLLNAIEFTDSHTDVPNQGANLRFWAVTTSDAEGTSSVTECTLRVKKLFPKCKVSLVFIEKEVTADDFLMSPAYREIEPLVHFARIPKSVGKLLPTLFPQGMRLEEIEKMCTSAGGKAQLAAGLRSSTIEVGGFMNTFGQFLNASRAALEPLLEV